MLCIDNICIEFLEDVFFISNGKLIEEYRHNKYIVAPTFHSM
jgi:hypothetical protein